MQPPRFIAPVTGPCVGMQFASGGGGSPWEECGGTLRAYGFCRVCRRHLQEIPSSSSNVSTGFTWDWDASRTSELLSSVGVSVLKKDKLGNENTPQDLLVALPCPPQKRLKVKEKDFVIARRSRLLQEADSGTVTLVQVSLTLQQRWRVGITSLLYCVLRLCCSFPGRASLLGLVAFRLGLVSPVLCKPLSRGGTSGSRTVATVGSCLAPPDPVCVLGVCAACPCVCLLLLLGTRVPPWPSWALSCIRCSA